MDALLLETRVLELAVAVLAEMNAGAERPVALERGADAPLYGRDGVLDSLGLVTLVVTLEQAIEDDLGVTVALADERAVSRSSSPFRTVGSLVGYAVERIADEGDPA